MEFFNAKFESGDRGPVSFGVNRKIAIPERGFSPVVGDLYQVEVVKDTAPGERRGVLIVRSGKNLSEEKRIREEVISKRAKMAYYDMQYAPGAKRYPSPGERECLKWRDHYGGARYDEFPGIWAQRWGVNAPEEFLARTQEERASVIFTHMKVIAALQAVSSGIPHEMLIYRDELVVAEKAANVLEKEIMARLPPCKTIYHSARDPFSVWDDSDISINEWETREDGLTIASVALPGELEHIKKVRDNAYDYRMCNLKVDSQTKCGFNLQGEASFILLTQLRVSRNEQEIARIEGGVTLHELPQAILTAGEELFLIVELKIKKIFPI